MKRFFIALMLCLTIAFNYNFISFLSVTSHADATVTATGFETTYNMYNKYRYSGALPTSSDSASLDLALTEVSDPSLSSVAYSRLFANPKAGTIVLHFCDSAGNPYTTTESNGTYTVTSSISGVKALSYTSTRLYLTVAGNITGDLNLYYYGTVTEGGDTYNTSVSVFKITFSNKGVYFKAGYDGCVTIDADSVGSYTFDEAFVKSYIVAYFDEGTTYTVDDLSYGNVVSEGVISMSGVIDKTLFNTQQEIPIHRLRTLDNYLETVGRLYVYIEQEVILDDTISLSYDGTAIPTTSATSRKTISINAGEDIVIDANCTTGLRNISATLSETDIFDLNYEISYAPEDTELTNPLSAQFTLRQSTLSVGTFNLEIYIADVSSGYEEIVYLSVVVSATQKPIIILYQTEIEVEKYSEVDYIEETARGNLRNIILYDGTYVDEDIFQDPAKVIITHPTIDTTIAGSYTITYSYTDVATSLTGTTTATLVIVDTPPEIISVMARVEGTDANIAVNEEIPLGTSVYFVINATDHDGDTITYNATASRGTITQDGSDLTKFSFTPTMAMAGEITFTFFVSDGHSTSENTFYKIIFKDETPPTIYLADLDGDDSITLDYDGNTGDYSLIVRRDTTVYFREYLEDVADNSSTLSTNDVIITTVGFSFSGGLERYSFREIAEYAVKYTLFDQSNNETTLTVPILIQNQAPTGQNKDYEFAYTDDITFDLSTLATDDASGVQFINSGISIVDGEGLPIITNLSFNVNGIVTISFHTVYNETQERDIPFIGVGYLKYKVIDCDDAMSEEYTVTLNIVDKTAPEATLAQDKTTTFIKGREYPDFAADGYFTAFDEIDGALTPISVKIFKGGVEVPSVDFATTIGGDREYQLAYLFKDSAGNQTQRSITVHVVSGGNPIIEMLNTSASIPVGGKFNIYDFMYKITDTEDGTITSGWKDLRESGFLNIDDSTVDVNKPGTYTIKLYFVDSDGNTSSVVEFTLTVEEKKEFPMEIIYYGAAALGVVLAAIIIRVIVVKRRMRI